ncbi:TonB-dependent receptor [Aestuariibaculum suncheonense]
MTKGLFKILLLVILGSSEAVFSSNGLIKTNAVNDFNEVLQQRTVTGKVTDQSGIPLPGVSIVVKGTTRGVSTDFDGKYSINITDGEILVFSFIGFIEQEFAVNGNSTVNITLNEDVSELNEVVVVGYGTQSKKDLTGSVSVVKADEIIARSTTNVSNALQGTVSGVSVTRSNSEPGSGNTIRVRGITTLQGENGPLVLVDNIPVGSINDVNADEIESISVLKDGASASIYGSRAAAGVILITTKKAKTGKFTASYSGEYFTITPTQVRRTVGAIRYLEMFNEQEWNDAGNAAGKEYLKYDEDFISNYLANNQTDPDNYPNTNWRDLILKKNTSGYRHNVSFSGGTDKIKSVANFGYETQDALYNHRDWTRITGRLNNSMELSDKFGANLDFGFRLTDDNRPVTDPTIRAIESAPIYAALWQDGRIAEGKTGDNVYARLEEGGFSKDKNYLFYGRFEVYFNPINDLKLSLNIAPRHRFNKYKQFNQSIPYWAFDNPNQEGNPEGYISSHNDAQISLKETRRDDFSLTTQALANYDSSFGKHNVSATLGYEEFSSKSERLGIHGRFYLDNNYPYLSQAPVDGVFNIEYSWPERDNYTYVDEYAYRSVFGRAAYDFDKKYLIQGSIRRDGSSRFGKAYRWGSFPSVAAGWVVSEENFMAPLKGSIDFLKFRATYGSLGNDRLGNYLYQSVLQFSNVLISNGSNVESVRTAAQRYLAVEDITWETTTSFNLGLDLNMFNYKLSVTADYFKKETTDMLLDLSIPALSGYEDPTDNVGSMDTKGWEVAAIWKDNIGKLKYSASFNIYDSESIIGDIADKQLFSENTISEQGVEFRTWYGLQSDGIYQTQDEVVNSAVTSGVVSPGDIKYKDISGPDGEPDGKINEHDRTYLGGSLPRYQYGGNINLAYKGFDFGVAFQGVGKYLKNIGTSFIRPFKEDWLSPPQLLDGNYWSAYNTPEENLNAIYPRLSKTSGGNNYRFSDFYLKDASYLRIKNITLGYTIPSKSLKSIGISSLRLYVSGNDLFTFDKLPEGIDPEQGGGSYLITKSYIFGIKANF